LTGEPANEQSPAVPFIFNNTNAAAVPAQCYRVLPDPKVLELISWWR
jgi:hypothetical protein